MLTYPEVGMERISSRETAWETKAITNHVTLLRFQKLNRIHPDILSITQSKDQKFISMRALTKSENLPT